MKYRILALLLSLLVSVAAQSEAQQLKQTGRLYNASEVVDLLLEGLWYDLYAYQQAISSDNIELSSWLFLPINRYLILASVSGASAEDLGENSLESICLVSEDKALLGRLYQRPGGARIKDWILKSRGPIQARLKLLQESYGGGAGCSVTNENGDVFRRTLSNLE